MTKFFAIIIFFGGGLGSISRYFISNIIAKNFSTVFPLATLLINISGSFLIGVCFEFFRNNLISNEVKLFFSIGFLGGYTTFSTFSLETASLFEFKEYSLFFANILLSNILGLLAVFSGMYISKLIISRF